DGAYLVGVGFIALVVAAGVVALDRAIDAGAAHVALIASDGRYSTDRIEVPSGRDVVLSFANAGSVFHDWHVEGLANVEAAARPGQTQTVRFRIDTPGSYPYECTVDGHAVAGMHGVISVTATGPKESA